MGEHGFDVTMSLTAMKAMYYAGMEQATKFYENEQDHTLTFEEYMVSQVGLDSLYFSN